jgi:RNA polymerase sigma-B factor
MNVEKRHEQVPDLDVVFWAYERSGREEDLETLVVVGQRLVAYFGRVLTGGVSDDVMQVGMEGLMKAVSRFDKDQGASFSTYVGHCVMGEIRHFIRKEASYQSSGRIAELQQMVNHVVDEAVKKNGVPPTLTEIAVKLNVTESGVAEAMRAGLVSLDQVDIRKIQSGHYESFRLPIEDKLVLEQALKKLDKIQRRVIYLLFYKDLTQTQAAEVLGMNQRQVSRILHKSLEQMSVVMQD